MDFTGKLICQTYPRLIQIDTGSNTIQDGLGNIIHILPTTASYALTASYAVSASYEINYETSSSYADFAVSSSKAANAYWTESVDGSISRNSDVKITGSLDVSGSLNVGINNTTPHQIIGVLGINTYAPSKQVEINSGDGNNFRLTYNDNNGSPANYTDFLLNAVGALRIVSSNGNLILSGSVDVERGITGSLIGTASWAENSLTASYFATASITPSASYVNTSNLPESVKTIFANYTASINDKHLFVSSSSDLSMLLYPASSIQGKSLYVKLLDNVLFTIYPDGSDIIEFDTFLQMENKGISVELIPSGNNWFVI